MRLLTFYMLKQMLHQVNCLEVAHIDHHHMLLLLTHLLLKMWSEMVICPQLCNVKLCM